ncbi:FadD3 family acyl-CoA ligase [Dietzia psychralcaliphila]|uniref:Fatty acid--CoA ligase n=1 Tax=Dietzia psychralcaliphila TaxID=139021 RepID=A0AAD0JQ27_9ACTN|nr:FadD3 family acyl-CoA ligase [Dietzia psychralcaliphila]AWH94669.1 fatty acid--CoA ligase [Dietzia psychralcaliphila]PTM86350.1 acyl-CoA synthetase (AMP-forming)/AMP-acid ligase II [Dietzia psychralcaliphila]
MTDRPAAATRDVETTAAALRRAAELWPDREAIADVQPGQDTRWTWSQLLDEVRRFAAGLITRGVGHGDRVVIWAPNTRHWIVAALGVQYAGGTVVPANTRYTGSETLELVQRTNASAAVVAGAFLGAERIAELTSAAGGSLAGATTLRILVRIPLDGGDTAATDIDVLDLTDLQSLATESTLADADTRADAVTGEDVADILFTSGTTGKSKGVVALHRQTVAGARAWGSNGGLTERDRYLIVNPFFHSFGYKAGFLVCTLFGATIIPLAVYSPTETMRLIQQERASVLPGAPTIFQTILDAPDRSRFDLSSLRLAVTGASVVPVVLVERMQSDLGLETVLTAYGQTETMGFITTTTADDDDVTVATTCGRAYPGMEIRIGDKGEILTRGEMVMQGYLDDPENTADTIDPDGWLHTGDVGEIDSHGNLRITDRLKDMYITGGFNVYPAEVEQTLARLDGVVETAVIGVPDDRMGEVGKAFVVLRDGSSLTEEDVLGFCREHLANFKRPRAVEFVESFPRNASGKILKTDLR